MPTADLTAAGAPLAAALALGPSALRWAPFDVPGTAGPRATRVPSTSTAAPVVVVRPLPAAAPARRDGRIERRGGQDVVSAPEETSEQRRARFERDALPFLDQL